MLQGNQNPCRRLQQNTDTIYSSLCSVKGVYTEFVEIQWQSWEDTNHRAQAAVNGLILLTMLANRDEKFGSTGSRTFVKKFGSVRASRFKFVPVQII